MVAVASYSTFRRTRLYNTFGTIYLVSGYDIKRVKDYYTYIYHALRCSHLKGLYPNGIHTSEYYYKCMGCKDGTVYISRVG